MEVACLQVQQVATQEKLDEILSDSGDALVCIDFTATWCSPCQQIAPAVEQLSQELTDVVFLKVDVDENEVRDLHIRVLNAFVRARTLLVVSVVS